jgi:putative transposase
VVHVQRSLEISERRACRTIGQPRSTQRRPHQVRDDEAALTAAIIRLASAYGRYGYRRIVNAKRVQRIWRREGLKVPAKQPKRGRLWLNDGSCIRLRPQYPNHVWAYDFVADRTVEGRPLKMLTVIDEFSRQCLAITVARRLNSADVLATLTELMVKHGPPAFLRSDNGGEFTAGVVRDWRTTHFSAPL